jgi:hypothetical protein
MATWNANVAAWRANELRRAFSLYPVATVAATTLDAASREIAARDRALDAAAARIDGLRAAALAAVRARQADDVESGERLQAAMDELARAVGDTATTKGA